MRIQPWYVQSITGNLNMSETIRTILAICILIIVYILTRRVHGWRIKRAYTVIIKDLEQKGALDSTSAVVLPYAKKGLFRVGVRDYRPKALEYLILGNIVGVTDSGKHYLKNKKGGPLSSK